MHIVIPDNDPMISLLEQRAIKRGLSQTHIDRSGARAMLRKKLPKLVRELVREKLGELNQHGDPMETAGSGTPAAA